MQQSLYDIGLQKVDMNNCTFEMRGMDAAGKPISERGQCTSQNGYSWDGKVNIHIGGGGGGKRGEDQCDPD